MGHPSIEVTIATKHNHPSVIAIRFSNDSTILIFPKNNLDSAISYASIWNANDAGWYLHEFMPVDQKPFSIEVNLNWDQELETVSGMKARLLGPLNSCDGPQKIVAVTKCDGFEDAYVYAENGRLVDANYSPLNLVNSKNVDYNIIAYKNGTHDERLRIIQAARKAATTAHQRAFFDGMMLADSANLNEHPEWFKFGCACDTCLSYGNI